MNIKTLEGKMVTYGQLIGVKVRENKEDFVPIDTKIISVRFLPQMNDMEQPLKGRIFVRSSVYKKIISAQRLLQQKNPQLALCITYGFRSLEVQSVKFQKQISAISNVSFFSDPSDLYEEAHRYVAVPTVAGHPTGGAVDVAVIERKEGRFLDFGSDIYDFSNKRCYVFFPTISKRGKKNRLLLRSIMLRVGFAPFDGEWWHFSYGDREWAYYYRKARALYQQVGLETVLANIT